MKKKRIEKIIVFISVAAVLALFVFFLKDIMIPLFRLQFNNDVGGAKALLTSKGIAGGIAVILIEALQMVVIFIPAEFIQVSAGLSYPFYIAALLCDAGVCLGASIIFILVRTFRFDTARARKTGEEIAGMARKKGELNVQLLMYLLFITPIIPFGAICYYGSSTDIRYRRYILTVATGVIPSIITSNLIGATAKAFLMNALPLWLLVLIIIFLMACLFVLLWLFLDKIYFKNGDGTPDSAAYFLVTGAASLWRRHCQRLHVDNEKLKGLEPPFVVLCNHVSFYDFYYTLELLKGYNCSYVINHHITEAPVLRYFSRKSGMIPKKMFYPDTAGWKMIKKLKAGYPVVVFAEGRLSVDGRNNPIVESAAAVYQRLRYPIVLAHISGGYFSYPKWRGRFFRSDVNVSVTRVIQPEELKQMSAAELEKIIAHSMTYDESENPVNSYRKKNMAVGLENVLYRCADCGELYTTRTKGCDIFCTACSKSHHLDANYRFTGDIGSIPEYYDRIKDYERAELNDLMLQTEADVKVYSDNKPRVRKEKGVCTLTKDEFTYRSDNIEFSIPTENIPALAFSCNKEFELYHNDLQYYFYPVENRRQAARWALIVDLLREERMKNGQE